MRAYLEILVGGTQVLSDQGLAVLIVLMIVENVFGILIQPMAPVNLFLIVML